MLVASKQATEWRGVGVAHQKQLGKHRNSQSFAAGLSTTLCLKGGTRLQCLAGHIPHHATIPETQHILTQWGNHVGPTKLVVGMDANEVFAQPHAPFSTSARSFTGRGECILQWLNDYNITLPLQDISSPTHFPYNTTLRPRRLDYIASRHNTTQQGGVVACRHRASTDHDGVQLRIRLQSKNEAKKEPTTWGHGNSRTQRR